MAHLTLKEAAEKYKKNIDTIRRWCKNGSIEFEQRAKNQYFVLEESLKLKLELQTDVVHKPREELEHDAELDGLEAMLNRLRLEERTMFKELQAEQKAVNPSMSRIKLLRVEWNRIFTMRVKLEKDMPKMLFESGKFVDVDLVAQSVNETFSSLTSLLDQLGMNISDRLASMIEMHDKGIIKGMTPTKAKKKRKYTYKPIQASELKSMVDKQINLCQQIIVDGLNKTMDQ